jgi:hypothetical protein
MSSLVEVASPLEVASLWRLGFLTGDDVSAICMRWLEEDLDRGDPNVAAFAGEAGLSIVEIAPAFERALQSVGGRPIGRDEAILHALRLHLAAALEGDLMTGVQNILYRFQGLSERRLVHNPRRAMDRPEGVYAEQELGLEYIYGGYFAFDDIGHLSADEQEAAKAELRQQMRDAICELKDHLAASLGP